MDICCYIKDTAKKAEALMAQLQAEFPRAAVDVFLEKDEPPAPRKISVWDWDRGGWFRDYDTEKKVGHFIRALELV